MRCRTAFLPGKLIDYVSDEYREAVDGDASVSHFFSRHDAEQARLIELLGTGAIRGKVIADIGCGGGSFLDLVVGMAAVTVAIDPARSYADSLRARGHRYFADTSQAVAELARAVDLAVCFSVVEHVEDPVGFLRGIRALLKPEGCLILTTPNAADMLLDLLPVDYGAFFYRTVHRWYFEASSLTVLAERAGFQAVVRHFHRFDMGNFLLWLRDRKPTGLGVLPTPAPLDAAFRATLCETGKADYLWAELIPQA